MKIAFTSCMDATRVRIQPIWKEIQAQQPDVLLLLGDQIYMDWGDLGASNWKRFIEKNTHEGLALYAEEMHARYKAQAEVPEFLTLLQSMRAQRKQVILTWDDHDFAWNNALGLPPSGQSLYGNARDDWEKHGVFLEVKALSLRLFEQFKAFVSNPAAAYPLADATAPAIAPPRQLQVGDGTPIDFLLLDTRASRMPRSAGSTLLSAEQRQELIDAIARPDGLLIVAGGTPIKHKYVFSDQDWVGDDGDEYLEYRELIEGAKRPVLYLSGDVHRIAWGGRIPRRGGAGSEVIQVLASPAAIARVGPKRFLPSCGLITVHAADARSGMVDCELRQGTPEEDGYRFETPPSQPKRTAPYTATGWTGLLGGEASQDIARLAPGVVSDTQRLAVLASFARTDAFRSVDPVHAKLENLETIDKVFEEKGLPQFGLPEPLWVTATANQTDQALTLTLVDGIQHGSHRADSIKHLVAQAFAAAQENKTSVVLFIHGVGKSPMQAIDQGYSLRALYGCEPIVFCWPAGRSSSGLRSLLAPFQAKRTIPEAANGLREVIRFFSDCAQAHPLVFSVILARSAGATLLHQALGGGDSAGLFTGVQRIVLSSPAIEAGDFVRKTGNAFTKPGIPETLVTVNLEDPTLQRAKWVSKWGDALGVKDPRGAPVIDRVKYLDFRGIGPMHDYLLVEFSETQKQVNRSMLVDKVFQPGPRTKAGAHNVFEIMC